MAAPERYALAHGDVAGAAGFNAVAVLALPILAVLWSRWMVRRARGVHAPMVMMSARALLALGAVLVVFAIVRNLPFGAALGP